MNYVEAYTAALRYPDEDAYAAAFGEEARPLWGVACLPFREFMSDRLHMRRVDLHRRYGIPLRTIEDWMYERRTPPPYVRLLLAIAEKNVEWK